MDHFQFQETILTSVTIRQLAYIRVSRLLVEDKIARFTMDMLTALAVGVVAAGALVFAIRSEEKDVERYRLAVGLGVVAAVYAAFSMNAGPGVWVLAELAGVGLFGVIAIVGYRHSALVVAAGWMLHVGWDVMHHVVEVRFVPSWYPDACISFDLVVAVYLAVRSWRASEAAPA